MNLISYPNSQTLEAFANQFFHDSWTLSPKRRANSKAVAFHPRVDIRDEKEAVVLSAELPGILREDLKVELKEGVLSIRGEKRAEQQEHRDGFYRAERVYGSFERSFALGDVVDPERIQAHYQNGVLKLVMNKRPEMSPKQIEIQGAPEKEIAVD